jgi:predicted transposase YbfD/YdcC
MRCTVKKTLEAAKRSGNDVLVQVKRNQPALYTQLLAYAAHYPAEEECTTKDAGRNRVEQRCASVWTLPEGLLDKDWAALQTLIRVERTVDCLDTKSQTWHSRQETSWYVCTRALTADCGARWIRGHWGIENRCHYVRDVSLSEDASRIRMNPGVFAQLRTWALNGLRHAKHSNIKAAREVFAWDPDQLLMMFSCD